MLGVSLIEEILKKNPSCKIHAVVRATSKNIERLQNLAVNIVECDIDNYALLPMLICEPCEVFYHFGWTATDNRNGSVKEQAKNIQYTLNALDSAYKIGCKKFIGAGSQAEFGVKDVEKISPQTFVNPIQVYGIAKYAAGKLACMQADRYGMDCLWVRIFSVYGRFDKKTTMVQSTIEKLKNGERPSFTPAEQKWDYLYSSDAGEAFYLIGEKSSGCKVYCLGSGKTKTLKEYIQIIGNLVNKDIPLGIGDLPYPDNCVMNLCADISDLQHDTGWQPKFTFEEGIKDMLNKTVGGGIAII